MTTQALTLTDFLLARIAEDEAVARKASDEGRDEPDTASWWPYKLPGSSMRKSADEPTKTIIDSPGCLIVYEVCRDTFAEHIARHDPARVLAECEAKRRIVELAPEASGLDEGMDGDRRVESIDGPRIEPWCGDRILAALALPYADHPDYREEWKP